MKSRKKLTKAQDGKVKQGPLTEDQVKDLDYLNPSTATPVPYNPNFNTYGAINYGNPNLIITDGPDENVSKKKFARNLPFTTSDAVMKEYAQRKRQEEAIRSSSNFKFGGSSLKGSQLRRQASIKGLRTSRKHK